MPILWRVFLTNAAVLVLATLALVLSPVTVSFPVAITEAVVLSSGLVALLVVNFLLLRRVLEPLGRLAGFMGGVDPLRPGRRVQMDRADAEVARLADAFNQMIERLEGERRESARRMLSVQEAERRRLARELHDEVGQALTAVVLQLEHAAHQTGPAKDDEVMRAREAVRMALGGVRDLAKGLRPEALDDLGLPAALAALTNAVSRQTRVRVDRRVDADLPRLGTEEELVVYRVAQEALTNVVRHSAADDAHVELRSRDGGAELVITDRGSGFTPRPEREGSGIRGMRERAMLIGADLSLRSAPAEGTEVRLLVRTGETSG